MDNEIPEINELIQQFSKLPGLGPKSAKRIILKLINNKDNMVKPLAKSLAQVYKKVVRCIDCGNLKIIDRVCICSSDNSYDKICVVENLADMWCAPQWIITEIHKKRIVENKYIKSKKLNILNHTFKCINCSAGYREIDNHESACYHHTNTFNHNSGTYNCCNRPQDDRGCIIGYHVVNTYDYNLIYNMLNKNEDE